MGWMTGVRFSAGAGYLFSICLRVQTSSGVGPSSCSVDTGDSFPEGKAAGTWSWPLTSFWCRG